MCNWNAQRPNSCRASRRFGDLIRVEITKGKQPGVEANVDEYPMGHSRLGEDCLSSVDAGFRFEPPGQLRSIGYLHYESGRYSWASVGCLVHDRWNVANPQSLKITFLEITGNQFFKSWTTDGQANETVLNRHFNPGACGHARGSGGGNKDCFAKFLQG
jgi:hypothetical protein